MSEKNQSHKKTGTNTPNPDTKDPTLEIARINRSTTITVALFTLIGGIATAILASPFLLEYYRQYFPTPTPSLASFITETITTPPTDIFTLTPGILTPTFTETLPPSPTDLPTAAPQTAPETMTAQLTFSSSAGNAPLMVNFNARNSYVTRANLPTLTCIEKNVCSYTWSVRLGGTTIYGPSLGDSAFSYTFQKKGEYVVVVYVCRGDTCNFAAASISVK